MQVSRYDRSGTRRSLARTSARLRTLGDARDDVVAEQTRVADQSTRIAVVVEGCAGKLSPSVQAQWSVLAAAALAYASADPSSVSVVQGGQVLANLNAFGVQLTGFGCSNVPPPVPLPATPAPSSPADTISSTVKWVAAAVAIAAIAYAASPAIRAWAHTR